MRSALRARWQTASREALRGSGTALFTICMRRRTPAFADPAFAGLCLNWLTEALGKHFCRADAYCFMPDHMHALITGLRPEADAWGAVVQFKQRSGEWLLEHQPAVHWQKGFDVRHIRWDDSARAALEYVRNNPVRAGLVVDWRQYPYTGEIPWLPWRRDGG